MYPTSEERMRRTLIEGRERKRRERLHAQVGALKRRLDQIGPNPIGLRRARGYRLMSKIRRLETALDQMELGL
jgi:hypothetical protein